MAEYKSQYTGQEIDDGIGKANTAVQPEDLGNLAEKDTVDYETEVTNKPTIPSEVTESTVAGWGFTKNTGDYTKPTDGIPSTDMTEAVQAILEKASATNLSTYEINETDIGQTVLNYIVDNNPDLLKVTTQQGDVQDYYKGTDRQYYCLIGEYFMVLSIEGSEGSYNLDVKSYYFDGFSEVSGTDDGTNWTSITVNGTTRNIPSGGGSGAVTVEEVTNYKNKVLNVLGDSQTEANYHKTKIYHDWLKELLGLSKVNNYGISGSTIGYNADYNPMVTRYSNMNNNADIIIVMGGINDIGNYSGTGTSKVPLGTISDTTYDTFYGALKVLCEGLIAKYPSKQILFVTPTEVSNDWYPSGNKHRIPEGLTVQQYVNAMIEVCEMYSIPVYDAFGKLGLYAKDNSQNSIYVSDGLHLNNAGHKLLGRGLYNFILSLSRTEVSYVATSSSGDVAVTGVELDKNSSNIVIGNTDTLIATIAPNNATNKNVTWTTNSNNVSLSANGLSCTVTGVNEGNATVTVTTQDGSYTASCSVTVTASSVEVTDIELNKNTSTLSAGGTEQLSVTFTPSDATDKSLTWTTSDSNVATVSNGLVTAIDAGSATITATTTNNISDSCAYTVTDLLVGKKVTVSKAIAGERSYLTALIPTDSDFAQGNTISYKLEGANVQGMIDYSINTIGAYDSASNQLSPATAGNLLVQFDATVTVTGTTMIAQTPAVTFTRSSTNPYILVPMTISGTPDFSFTVTKCEIYVNGKRKYPIKYGAFADSSKEIITIE